MTRPIALVTGASSGIGRVYAKRLAADGYDLVITARREARLKDLARELEAAGAKAEIVVADLDTPEGVAKVEKRAAKGDIAMLVNNAGYQTYMPFVELDPDVAEAQIHAMVTAVVRLTRAVLPAMLKRGAGDIVNVSSTLAFSAGMTEPFLPKRANYAATKAFVNAFTEIVANEVAGTGVRLQALCPGVVQDRVPRRRRQAEDQAEHRAPGAGGRGAGLARRPEARRRDLHAGAVGSRGRGAGERGESRDVSGGGERGDGGEV